PARPRGGRLRGAGARQLRDALVPVVRAAARRAPGERVVRAAEPGVTRRCPRTELGGISGDYRTTTLPLIAVPLRAARLRRAARARRLRRRYACAISACAPVKSPGVSTSAG